MNYRDSQLTVDYQTGMMDFKLTNSVVSRAVARTALLISVSSLARHITVPTILQ